MDNKDYNLETEKKKRLNSIKLSLIKSNILKLLFCKKKFKLNKI